MKYFTLFTLSLLSTLSFAKAGQFNLEEATVVQILKKNKELADKLSKDNTNSFKKKKTEIKTDALLRIALIMSDCIQNKNDQRNEIPSWIDKYKRAAEFAVPETSLFRICKARVLLSNPTHENLTPWAVYNLDLPRGLCPIIMEDDPISPAVFLGLELPRSALEKVPDHIQRFIKKKLIKDLKVVICVQKLSSTNDKLSLKPQCWLRPDAPENASTYTNLQNVVFWKTFANTNSSEETDWAKETVSIHNTNEDPNNNIPLNPKMVLSGGVMPIEDRIDRKKPSSFYSLVVTEDRARGVLTHHTPIPLEKPTSDNPLWEYTQITSEKYWLVPIFHSFPGKTFNDYITFLEKVKSESNKSSYEFTNPNPWGFIEEIKKLVNPFKNNSHKNNNNNNAVQSEQKKTFSTGEQPFLINGIDATTLDIPPRFDRQKVYKLFPIYLTRSKITPDAHQELRKHLGTWLQLMETSASRNLILKK